MVPQMLRCCPCLRISILQKYDYGSLENIYETRLLGISILQKYDYGVADIAAWHKERGISILQKYDYGGRTHKICEVIITHFNSTEVRLWLIVH